MDMWESREGSMAVLAAERTPKASAIGSSVVWAGESIAAGDSFCWQLHDQDK